MAKAELGEKRLCVHCGIKFFDFNKSPIFCPKCNTQFQISTVSRQGHRPTQEDDLDIRDSSLVALEDVDLDDEKAVLLAEGVDIEDAGDVDVDDPFLEEEETHPEDVANLIDGDIHLDEEN